MASRGKNINLFLMDGEVNGRIKFTIPNWTGLAFKIPRTSLGHWGLINVVKKVMKSLKI